MGKEILTLQLGHKANYLATHFWNSQVSLLSGVSDPQEANFDYENTNEKPIIDNDIHFRAGLGHGGVETYTPRTLIYDLKGVVSGGRGLTVGGFGSLRKYNELYEAYQTEPSSTWSFNLPCTANSGMEMSKHIRNQQCR